MRFSTTVLPYTDYNSAQIVIREANTVDRHDTPLRQNGTRYLKYSIFISLAIRTLERDIGSGHLLQMLRPFQTLSDVDHPPCGSAAR